MYRYYILTLLLDHSGNHCVSGLAGMNAKRIALQGPNHWIGATFFIGLMSASPKIVNAVGKENTSHL